MLMAWDGLLLQGSEPYRFACSEDNEPNGQRFLGSREGIYIPDEVTRSVLAVPAWPFGEQPSGHHGPHGGAAGQWLDREHGFVGSNVELTGRRRKDGLAVRPMMTQSGCTAKLACRWRSG